jgi:hypothetical protein
MDGADILRDVLAGLAVAAGGGGHQHAMLVAQVDGEAIEFQFGGIFDRRICVAEPQFLAHPRVEGPRAARLSIGLGADRQHRHRVAHLGKFIERRAANALGGRIGCDEFGVIGFERLQFTEQPVIFCVCNGRRVENVVGVVVSLDFLAQRRGARPVSVPHQENRRSARREPDGTPRASMRS